MNPPKKIYLQWLDEDGELNPEVPHCVDQIHDTDVEYILKPEWKPIKTAPKDGTQILVRIGGGFPIYTAWWGDNSKKWFGAPVQYTWEWTEIPE